MKNLTWQNPEQLFVAQELINKVKSKCCGIKDKYSALAITDKALDMKLQNSTKEIIDRRKVYYVTIYNSRHMIVAFLGSSLHYVSSRTDAALFDTKEEAQELMNEAELNGICNTIPDFAKMTVSSDTQVLLQHWHF